MTTKKRHTVSVRHILWCGLKLVITLSILLCIVSLFKFQSQPSIASSIRRFRDHRDQHFDGPPKIAFLFLARKDLPLDFLWQNFFQHADEASFSIYIHSEPGFVFDESTTRSAFFYGRQLSKSIKVVWGESSMIEAERLLFGEALEDVANQRFVLLSDSMIQGEGEGCFILLLAKVDVKTVVSRRISYQNALVEDAQSWETETESGLAVCLCTTSVTYTTMSCHLLEASWTGNFVDVKGDRYHPKMSSIIPKDKWRKGSQWITLVRRQAEVVVDDDIILPVFKKYCKMGEFEDELERRTLTYSSWNESKAKMEKTGWHPVTFSYVTAGPQQIKEIKGISHVYYGTEFRTEWCRTNSISAPCFLFARKFSQGAAMRLLNEGVVGPVDTSTLIQARLSNRP
ncbi:hypothetical protein GIB67_026936 [Kingdonia uniflora]|uniref:Uncharacterized protein n=1 Tax=Kingdonia uniflora TaxID=39325 RepID=A0A7J7P1D9_9MAGN|nr:hypothetical protein GIB67_026936 [Kingdonia uniflora]